MADRFENAAAASVARVQDTGTVSRGVEQRTFGLADADADEALLVHRKIVEGVAGDEHRAVVDAEQAHQRRERAALVDAFGQNVEVAPGGVEHLAAERARDVAQFRRHRPRFAEIRAAALLRHFLSLDAGKGGHRVGDDALAGPALVDLRLQRLDRLQGMAVDDGAADVADDVIGRRDRRVGEQRNHHFQPTAGDEYQLDIGVRRDQLVQSLAVFEVTGEKGAVKIGREQHVRVSF